MKEDKLLSFEIILFFLLLVISFFLNFISTIYSEIDLFKVNLNKEKQSKNKSKIKRLIFVLKNFSLLFSVVCFLQVLINMLMSFLISHILKSKGIKRSEKTYLIIASALIIALFTEIFSRYLANRKRNKKLVVDSFFIGIAYAIIRPLSPLQKIIKPKKRLFSNSEKDISTFVENLALENILEKKEALLVQSVLRFDELKIRDVINTKKKIIFLNEHMNYEEVKKIHSKYFFADYPVLNKKQQVIGIFSTKLFYWLTIKRKDENITWQKCINKNFVYLFLDDKLDKSLEKLQLKNCHLAIVKKGKKFLSIITLKSLMDILIGNKREREREREDKPLLSNLTKKIS